jgi:excisionase family DNA binding protein
MSKGKQMPQPLVVHRKDAAVALGLSVRTIDRAIKRGDLRTKKYGTRVMVPQSEVERFARVMSGEDEGQPQ